jgi:hypothetical protein
MRKLLSIWALALWTAAGVLPAAAQDMGEGGQGGYEQQGGLPPSAAVKLAVAANPGAKPLGVKMSRGIYVVRLRQDGTIIQVGVDPATGDVFPLR